MAFEPSAARARTNGQKIAVAAYPDGAPGIKLSLETIARKIREGRLDPDVRGWAGDVLLAAGKPQGARAQAHAILNAFKQQTVYVSDPTGAEYISSAAATLCLRPGLCVRAVDCDDSTTAVGSALMSIGIPVHVVKQNFGPEHQEHVLLEAQDEHGTWFPIDPSTDLPVGRSYPAASEVRVDPMQQIGSTGTAGAEIVTLGKPPRGRALFYKGNHWYEFRYGRWWVHSGGRWHMGPGEPPVGIGGACCAGCASGGTCEGVGATLLETPAVSRGPAEHPNDPPQLASAVWEVIRPYQERVGVGDLPPGNWTMETDWGVLAGLRYVVIIGAPPKGLIFKDPWSQEDAMAYFTPNWSVESLSRQDVDSSGNTAWQMQGVARKSMQLTAAADAAKVSTAIVWKEAAPTPPAKPPPPTAAQAAMSTATKVGIGIAVGAAAVGGGILYFRFKHRKTRASTRRATTQTRLRP